MEVAAKSFNVVVIGAGEINFGSREGSWNHTRRLEVLLGLQLLVVALVDPNLQRARGRIADKRASQERHIAAAWADTEAFADVASAGHCLTTVPGRKIDLVVLGCPPHFRGTTLKGSDTDVEALSVFGDRARTFLVEKPIAALDPAAGQCEKVVNLFSAWQQRSRGFVGVGYMLRYLKAVTKMREILEANQLVPTCINARYFMAYPEAQKLAWWNKAASCGPIVEQATHFCDLIRFFAGADNEALLETVRATAVEHSDEAGRLSRLAFDEEAVVAAPDRVPRVTTAFWRHRRGTIASLCHGITLHSGAYDTQIELLADGWVMRLKDAYTRSPSLSIRGPHSEKEDIVTFKDDDPFTTQLEALVYAVRGLQKPGLPSWPLSSFEDAFKTYELTWQIRRASERDR